MDLEDIQGEEKQKAVEVLTDTLVYGMMDHIDERGGDKREFLNWLGRGETIGEIFEAVFAAMPNDYGVVTKEIKQSYHQSTIDDLTRHI